MTARIADRIRKRRVENGDWLDLFRMKRRSMQVVRYFARKGRRTAYFSPFKSCPDDDCQRATLNRWLLWIVSKGFRVEQDEEDHGQYIIGWGGSDK